MRWYRSACGELYDQWYAMTINPEQLMETTWLLSGQVDEGEPVREIPINSLPFRVGRRSDVSCRIPQSDRFESAR